MRKSIPTLAMLLIATTALAHGGVKNPAVLARMDLMVDVGDAMKVLGEMAKGAQPFDTQQADRARGALIVASNQVIARFEAEENDPKSEALPTIWSDWAGFNASAEDMAQAAESLDTSTLDGLRAGIGALGKSCGSCHESYRIKK